MRQAELLATAEPGVDLLLGSVLDDATALCCAWLPGTEGAGVADVLFGATPATAKLSRSWPRSDAGLSSNVGDAHYDPLFPYGFGLA